LKIGRPGAFADCFSMKTREMRKPSRAAIAVVNGQKRGLIISLLRCPQVD
jgi:hypothetical protein